MKSAHAYVTFQSWKTYTDFESRVAENFANPTGGKLRQPMKLKSDHRELNQ